MRIPAGNEHLHKDEMAASALSGDHSRGGQLIRYLRHLLRVKRKPFNVTILCRTVENLIHSREYLRNVTPDALQKEEDEDKPSFQAPDDRLVERAIRIII